MFPASSGQLVQRTQYSASFTCNFRLFWYPFDTQSCSVFLKLTSATSLVVTFKVILHSNILPLVGYLEAIRQELRMWENVFKKSLLKWCE